MEELSIVTDSDSASDSGAASGSDAGSVAFGVGAGFDFDLRAEMSDSLSPVDPCEVFLRFVDILLVEWLLCEVAKWILAGAKKVELLPSNLTKKDGAPRNSTAYRWWGAR